MSDFVFIIPKVRTRKEKTVAPPFPYLKLAAVLEKANFTTTLIDARIDTDYLHRIKSELGNAPLFIGITAMTGVQSTEGLKISKSIKKANPNIPIVWGGVHASLLPDEVLSSEYVDVVVIGEGEPSVVQIAKMYKTGEVLLDDIEGIAYKRDGSVVKNAKKGFLDWNSLPMPAWHLIENRMKYYLIDGGRGLNIITSAGCPHDCYFCYNMSYNQSRFRARPAEDVVKEIEFLYKKFNIEKIEFSDDNFSVNKKRVKAICDTLYRKNIDLDMRCDIRVDYLNEEFVSYLTKNGFRRFLLGVESGSQKMLDLINKRTTVEKLKSGISALNKYTDGGHVYSLMVGFPGETRQDIEKTWEFARWIYDIDKKGTIILNIYTPYPGVMLTDILTKNGYQIPKTNWEWAKYNLFSLENKKWIQEKKLIKSLVTICRLSFSGSSNKLARFLSKYAKKRFLTGKTKPYWEFGILYHLLKNF